MENIYFLLFISLLFWYFIYLRKVAEVARIHAKQYCQKESIQFLSIARLSSRLNFSKRLGLHWLSHFDFEFSGDGVSSYHGVITLRGLQLDHIHTPPYKIH